MIQPVVEHGRVWCHDEHRSPWVTGVAGYGRKWPDEGPKAFDTFGAWLFHRVYHHTVWPMPWWKEELARIGFVDTIPIAWGKEYRHEGGEMFWRWDFWNSGHGKEWRAVIARENEARTRAQRLKERLHG